MRRTTLKVLQNLLCDSIDVEPRRNQDYPKCSRIIFRKIKGGPWLILPSVYDSFKIFPLHVEGLKLTRMLLMDFSLRIYFSFDIICTKIILK